MAEAVDPGQGYRLLKEGEEIKAGDETCRRGQWHRVSPDSVGCVWSNDDFFPMRRLESPEPPKSSAPGEGVDLENYRSTMWYARTFIPQDALGKPVIEALEKHCAEIDAALSRSEAALARARSEVSP